ncbi:hypothetical protein PUN28_016164 [Cardiocondyla obscurior]|uniref:Uncharacterized protein n=1 Tax=Cardiocondyla obscurior TaxID=286306 RepID=A0AAW2EW68_9HYME
MEKRLIGQLRKDDYHLNAREMTSKSRRRVSKIILHKTWPRPRLTSGISCQRVFPPRRGARAPVYLSRRAYLDEAQPGDPASVPWRIIRCRVTPNHLPPPPPPYSQSTPLANCRGSRQIETETITCGVISPGTRLAYFAAEKFQTDNRFYVDFICSAIAGFRGVELI